MRAYLLAATLLAATALAGCGNDQDDDSSYVKPLAASDIALPTGAVLEAIEGGFAAVWDNVELPHVVTITVPEHATMVRAVAESGALGVSMSNEETGRRRCNNPSREDFTAGFGYPKSCSSVTALDAPGAQWRVSFAGDAPQNTADAAPPDPLRGDVRIEFLDAPLDGLLAGLDLSQITPPTHQLEDTVVEFIPSHDGILLRTERTLPAGDGPWPAIIVSSPYYDDGVRATPADWTYVVQDWAKRGYAMVTADVRGFGDSGGCVEVWGINEQLDQKVLVDWVAMQPWSDGHVGFYGQSYVGTTPVEAAVQAPEALKAIVTIAPVISAYEDWHHGGVPNGENELSPVAYQVTTDQTVTGAPGGVQEGNLRTDPQQLLNNAKNGPCDPTLVARSSDPRAIYDAFYEERDFKLRAGDVKAAVLYTEGFEDANVKSSMIPGWFNELRSPKLGLFGHWLHQHPARLDCEVLFVGWMEHYVKGKDLGFGRLPQVAVQVDRETHRTAQEWPPAQPVETVLHPGFGDGTLQPDPAAGSAVMRLDSVGILNLNPEQARDELVFTTVLAEDVSLAGVATVHIVGTLTGAANAYLGAALYEDDGTGPRLISWGQFNLAHREGHTQYAPVSPGETVAVDLPMLPTEDVLRKGSTLTIALSGVTASDATDPGGVGGVAFTFQGGEDGTRFVIPGVPMSEYHPIPLTARP